MISWRDLRDFLDHLPYTSALHRDLFPKSWWWTPEIDFMAAIFHSLQLGNWQRGGGKGARPQPIRKPGEGQRANAPATLEEARARKAATHDELARRRAQRKAVNHGES